MASPADSLFAPIRDAADRMGLLAFLRWWVSELAAMVPSRWRERLSSGNAVFVAAEGDDWRVLRAGGGALAEIGRATAYAAEGAGRRSAFLRLIEQATGGAANVWLVLPDDSVLVRTVEFPLAAEEALRDAVGFDLDRLTPFSADQAVFDFRVSGRDEALQRLTLDLAVTARGPVEARLAQLRGLGATVLGVGVAGDLVRAPVPFNLLAPESRARASSSATMVMTRWLAVLAGILAVAALVYPLWQKREAAIELLPRLEKAKAGAAEAERLAKEIETLAADHNFLLARKQAQYPAFMLLEDLSRLLPDATWVQQLDIKGGPKLREVQIAGETGSSSQLIEVLEKSGSLANASFKSPLTKGVTPNTDRFLVAAEVKLRPLPEPLPESALLSPAPAAAAATGSATPGPQPAPATPGPQPAPAAPAPAAVPSQAPPAASPPAPAPAPLPATPGKSATPPPGPSAPPSAARMPAGEQPAAQKAAAAPGAKPPEATVPAKAAPKG